MRMQLRMMHREYSVFVIEQKRNSPDCLQNTQEVVSEAGNSQ